MITQTKDFGTEHSFVVPIDKEMDYATFSKDAALSNFFLNPMQMWPA